MTLLIKDRVQEITSSGGTGPILLGTSFIAGYVDIGTAIGNGNTTPYVITDTTNNVYEIGVGQYILANTSLLRLQVLASSNANALVNFVAGPKNVFVDVPAAYISLTVRGLNQFASTTSANLASIISDAVGTGPLVFANNAVFVGPTIGVATGTSLTLSTALPIASGGTNSTATPTAGGAGYGTGTAHAYTAAGSAGQVLTSAGVGAPTWTTPTTAVTTISGGTTGLTPASATSGTVTLGGTLVASNGGTGVATLTGLVYGNGTAAMSAATAAQVVGVIGATAVTNATNSTACSGLAASATLCNGNYNTTNAQNNGTDGWWRSTGSAGWYSTSFGVGIYATETTNVRTYNGANFIAAGNVTAYSDIRLKENVKTIPNALEKVQAIRGVTFTRNDMEDTEKVHTGVIAQEVLAVFPEAVMLAREDDFYTVAYGNMVGLLIEAIKEQQSIITNLSNRLDALESK